MTYRKYLFIIGLVAVSGWVSLVLVIRHLSPCQSPISSRVCEHAAVVPLLLLFLSAFFALTATFTLMGFALRLWLHRYEIYLDHLNVALRQGLLLTLCTLGALGLLLLGALTWWNGLLLILIIVLLELYFTRAS